MQNKKIQHMVSNFQPILLGYNVTRNDLGHCSTITTIPTDFTLINLEWSSLNEHLTVVCIDGCIIDISIYLNVTIFPCNA